jgi:hypothetical protein
MAVRRVLFSTVAMVGVVVLTWTLPNPAGAQPATQITIDNDDIPGVVKTPSGGPEVGVWVIAETTELPTKYAKIVVTDDGLPPPANCTGHPRRLRWGSIGLLGSSRCASATVDGLELFGRASPIIRLRPGSKECEVSKFCAALLPQLMFVCLLARLRAEPRHPSVYVDAPGKAAVEWVSVFDKMAA